LYVNSRERLDKWASSKLEKYDSDDKFKEKRDKKYGDRDGYKKFLDGEVEKSASDAQTLIKK